MYLKGERPERTRRVDVVRWMMVPPPFFFLDEKRSRKRPLGENEFSFRLVSNHLPCRRVQDTVGYTGLGLKSRKFSAPEIRIWESLVSVSN